MAVYLARRSSLVIFGFGPPLRFRRWGDDDGRLLLLSSDFDVDFIVLLLISSMVENGQISIEKVETDLSFISSAASCWRSVWKCLSRWHSPRFQWRGCWVDK